MDDFIETKSCWGITVRAVAVFAGIVAFSAVLSDEEGLSLADPGAAKTVADADLSTVVASQ